MRVFFLSLVFVVSNFLAWNFFGLLFVFSVAIVFQFLSIYLKRPFWTFLSRVFLLLVLLNISVTFWLFNVSILEAINAFLFNSLIMSIPFILTFFGEKIIRIKGELLFIPLWAIFEVFHGSWILGWPWLTFGNVMANQVYLVQWFSFLGIYSGSLWLLLLGYLFSQILFAVGEPQRGKTLKPFILLLFIPVIFSLMLYFGKPLDQKERIKITTYIPKNSGENNLKKTQTLFQYTRESPVGNYILSPELFLSPINLSGNNRQIHFYFFDRILEENDSIIFFFGAELKKSNTHLFNAFLVYDQNNLFLKGKRKHVPIKEYTPPFLRFIWGESFYYGPSIDDQSKIKSQHDVFPVLCYESIFSNYISKNLGSASVIFLITSEEFMGNSYFGKRQYFNLVRLMALEANRNLIKCSNGGFSAVFNEKGQVTAIISNEFETVSAYRITKSSFLHKIKNYI